jgi:hypothetical protein
MKFAAISIPGNAEFLRLNLDFGVLRIPFFQSSNSLSFFRAGVFSEGQDCRYSKPTHADYCTEKY